MKRRVRGWIAAGLSMAVASHGGHARAGNDEGFLLGNQAALSGGAVTATVSEGSAVWYNPAGLAAVQVQSLDLSASAYGFRYYHAPRFLSTSDGQSESLGVVELVIVPTALSFVRPLTERLRVGFGLFVPHGNDLVLRGDLNAGSEGRWLVSMTEYARLTYGGPSLAWSVAPGLRFGASLLGFYEYEQTGLQIAGGQEGDTDGAASFITASSVSTRSSVGAMLILGVQWDASPEWRIGVAVRSPSFNVFSDTTDSGFTTSALDAGEGTETSFLPQTSAARQGSFAQTTPVQLRAGLARVWGESWLAIDGDAQPGLSEQGAQRTVPRFNVRVGGQYQLSERLSVGLGVFTDRDSTATDVTSPRPLHFYGGSAGVRWGKVYRLEGEPRRAFDFTTTLALRYAYGSGDVAGLRVASVSGEDAPFASTPSNMTIHEAMLHVGSGFYF